eukprot:1024163_1
MLSHSVDMAHTFVFVMCIATVSSSTSPYQILDLSQGNCNMFYEPSLGVPIRNHIYGTVHVTDEYEIEMDLELNGCTWSDTTQFMEYTNVIQIGTGEKDRLPHLNIKHCQEWQPRWSSNSQQNNPGWIGLTEPSIAFPSSTYHIYMAFTPTQVTLAINGITTTWAGDYNRSNYFETEWPIYFGHPSYYDAVNGNVSHVCFHSTSPYTSSTSNHPTETPSHHPTLSPSNEPTFTPSDHPTLPPSALPTETPSNHPTLSPSNDPTLSPSNHPTKSPSKNPTLSPFIAINQESNNPTLSPSNRPTLSPSNDPTLIPSGLSISMDLSETPPADSTASGSSAASPNSYTPLVISLTSALALVLCSAGLVYWIYRKKSRNNANDAMIHIKVQQAHVVRTNDDGLMTIKAWLRSQGSLSIYYDMFIQHGYERMPMIKSIANKSQLREIGVSSQEHQSQIMNAIKRLVWLESIGLAQYDEMFRSNGYESLDLMMVMENKQDLEDIGIVLKGHQKKILFELSKLKSDDQAYAPGKFTLTDTPELSPSKRTLTVTVELGEVEPHDHEEIRHNEFEGVAWQETGKEKTHTDDIPMQPDEFVVN